jgi:hypothetical protein
LPSPDAAGSGTGNGSNRSAPHPSPGAAGGRHGCHASRAMHQLAPASVVVAARFRAARQKRLRPHRAVLGAVPRGRVRRAPTNVEDLAARIGIGLTIGAVGTSDSGGVRKEVRHRSIARKSVAISTSTLMHGGLPTRNLFDAGRPTPSTRRGAAPFPPARGRRGGPPSRGGGPRSRGRPGSAPASRRGRCRGRHRMRGR